MGTPYTGICLVEFLGGSFLSTLSFQAFSGKYRVPYLGYTISGISAPYTGICLVEFLGGSFLSTLSFQAFSGKYRVPYLGYTISGISAPYNFLLELLNCGVYLRFKFAWLGIKLRITGSGKIDTVQYIGLYICYNMILG